MTASTGRNKHLSKALFSILHMTEQRRTLIKQPVYKGEAEWSRQGKREKE